MARTIDTRNTCVRYLTNNSRGNGVRLACTCGTSHGARSWRSFQSAVDELRMRGFDFSKWINDPMVSRMCRDYAEQGTGIESIRNSIKLT